MTEIRKRVRPASPAKNAVALLREMDPHRPDGWTNNTLHDAFSDRCVMGLDLSLTSTGLAVFTESLMLSRPLEPKKLKGAERLAWFHENIDYWVRLYRPVLVVVEGYAYEAKFGREAAGELGGVARLALHQIGIPFITYAPGELRKFATGVFKKGDKNQVALGLYKKYGVDAGGNDETDAAGYAIMGAAHLGFKVQMNAAQQEAVAKTEK